MQQYFLAEQLSETASSFRLDKADSHHLFTVLRAQAGMKVQVVFADQTLILAQVNEDLATLSYLETLSRKIELPVNVTIAVGLPKGDKLEFIAQKVTELGAFDLLAFPAKWSVTRLDAKKAAKKTERLQKIAKGAAEQSKRLRIPTVSILNQLADLTAMFKQYDQVLVAYEAAAKDGEASAFARVLASLDSQQKILVIFGPEGGISPEEVSIFTDLGAVTIGLGPRIMRAETAPMYVLSAISFYTELLGA